MSLEHLAVALDRIGIALRRDARTKMEAACADAALAIYMQRRRANDKREPWAITRVNWWKWNRIRIGREM